MKLSPPLYVHIPNHKGCHPTCGAWLSPQGSFFDKATLSLIWWRAKAMVTQGEAETTQAGLLGSSCSSWCLVFLGGVFDSGFGWDADWFCTKSIVAIGTGLEGTGMFSANIEPSVKEHKDCRRFYCSKMTFFVVKQQDETYFYPRSDLTATVPERRWVMWPERPFRGLWRFLQHLNRKRARWKRKLERKQAWNFKSQENSIQFYIQIFKYSMYIFNIYASQKFCINSSSVKYNYNL